MCRTLLAVGLTALLLGPSALRADDPPPPRPAGADPAASSERARVAAFLKEQVIGKTLELQLNAKIDQGRVDVDFSRRTTFTNWAETPTGFRFDEVAAIRQTNYDLDGAGKRVLPGTRKDRTVMVRWEIGERKSTGKLVGVNQVVLNTDVPNVASANAVQSAGVEDGKLVLRFATAVYEDFYAQGGSFKPRASESRMEMKVVGGKLERVLESRDFDVDPETLKRTPAGELYKMIDKQADDAGQPLAGQRPVEAEKKNPAPGAPALVGVKAPAEAPPAPMPPSKDAPEAAPPAPAKSADEVPADWQDAAFDRHVDLRLMRRAWARFDAALMADCGLQLAEGERVLMRQHRAFPAGKVLALAAKMAAERGDKDTLARLGRAAESLNSSELKSALKDAESKPAAEALKVSVDELTPEGLRALQGALAFVRRAKLTRDPELLAQMEKALPQVAELGNRGKQMVEAEIRSARAAMPKPPEPGKRALVAGDATAIRLNAVLPPCSPANPATCN